MTQKRSEFGDFLFGVARDSARVYLAGMSTALVLQERTAEDPRLLLDTPPLTMKMEDAAGDNNVDRRIMEATEAVDAVSDPEEERFQNAVSDARAAFWRQLKTHYPEIPATAVMSDRDIEARFEISTEGAADAWVSENTVQVLDSKGGDA